MPLREYAARPVLVLLLTALLLLGCDNPAPPDRDVIFQQSTLEALQSGEYDGQVTYSELEQHGDFGLGTFHALDGEMVAFDGGVYQVTADGVAHEVEDSSRTPFAVMTYFDADQAVALREAVACPELGELIDAQRPDLALPYAIKVSGNFESLTTRSVPRQEKPYPPLADVIAVQPTFEFVDVKGVMVGFRLPDIMDGANATGYHWHFLTNDRTSGGHVLVCRTADVLIEIDQADEWQVKLPGSAVGAGSRTRPAPYPPGAGRE